MIFTPRNYQELIKNFSLDHDRCNIFASPGTGKTSSMYEFVSTLHLFGETDPVLVLGPKRVAKNVWPAEREKWMESFGHLRVAAAVGTPDQRIAAVRSKPDLLFVNYETIEWLVDGYGDKWPFRTVIADESGRLKGLRIGLQRREDGKMVLTGQGSVRARALRTVAHRKVRRWVNLNGSPAPNGVVDLYGQMWFIDNGKRLGTNFGAFQERYFYSRRTPDGYTQMTPLAHAQAEIESRIKDVCLTIDARDYFDIREPIERHVMIDLPPKARRQYETMQKDFFADVEAGRVEAFGAGGKMNKTLQIASGSMFVDDKRNWEAIHDEKIDALASLVSEFNGEPLLVRYIYRPDLERILKAFPRARYLDEKKETEDAWNRGEIPMLVTHAASAGHGLSLQYGGRVLVDYSSDMNLDHDEQIIERIGPTRRLQSGLDQLTHRIRLIARDTIEQHSVLPRLKEKISVQESVKRAMKK